MGNVINIDRSKLHPWLDHRLTLFLKDCNESGYYLTITEGFRTVAYQDSLYAKGRTTSGTIVTNARGRSYSSQHQWGIAFDIAIRFDVNHNGSISDDTWNAEGFKKVAQLAKKHKLFGWGGDWKSIVDRPHFYLTKWGSDTSKLKKLYGTPDVFKKTWKKKTVDKVSVVNNQTTRKIIATLPKGKTVNVLYKTKLGYSKVTFGDTVGYIKTKYLQ